MKSSKNTRWVSIDVYKGIGISLVVLGHSSLPKDVAWWIWSFHMPMFFFVSGYLFDARKFENFFSLVKRKSSSLIRPYLFFSAIAIIFGLSTSSQPFQRFEVTQLADISCILLIGWKGLALWFIPVLFFTECVYFWMSKINNKALYFSIILMAFFGYFLSIERIHLPYKIEVVPTALTFYALGNVFKESLNRVFVKINSQSLLLISLAFLLLNICFCFLNTTKFDMCFNVIGNFPFAYMSAFFGIAAMFSVSNLICRDYDLIRLPRAFLSFIGVNSLIILGVHQLLKLLANLLIPDSTLVLTATKHIAFLFFLGFIIFVLNKYLRYFLGKNKLIINSHNSKVLHQ